MRAVIVEDHAATALAVQRVLVGEGLDAAIESQGDEALATLRAGGLDLIVLDLRLPGPDGVDGVDICRTLRAEGHRTPVLMLTGRGSTTDVVRGLEAGADDYLAKPVAIDELRARVRALLRRGGSAPPAPQQLEVGDLRLDPDARSAEVAGRPVELTGREFDLLVTLVSNAGRVLSREHLLREVWRRTDPRANPKVVDVYVSYLRRKLVPDGGAGPIESVRGVGYRYRPPRPGPGPAPDPTQVAR